MSWVTVVWSMGAAGCLILALMHAVVWWKDRTARANLIFAVMAVAVAVFSILELALMRTQTPRQFGMVARWMHVPGWVIVTSLVCFVRLYLRAGRRWLAWMVVGIRTLSLILNFVLSPNLNYREITALRHIQFLGESVSVAEGVANPWALVAQLSLLLLVIFVTDATITVWRRGDRRRALLVGGSIVLFAVGGSAEPALITWGIMSIPVTVSLFYQGIVAAMAVELSYDVLRAAQITRQLQASEAELREEHQRMDLATAAAKLGIWVWDVARNEIWISEEGRVLFGFAPSEKLDIDRFQNAIHPDDRNSMRRAVENSLSTGREYEAEHRVLLPGGQVRWLAGRGRVEFDTDGKPVRMRGVSADVTRRKLREAALRESEERFRTMANTAPVMIWMSGTDKLCTFFNKPWLEFTGRTMEQEIGNGWAQGVHPDDLESCLKTYTEAFDARQPFVRLQYRLRRRDGEYRWISDDGVPLYDTEKNFAGYIGSCIDITERKQAEELFRLATEASPSGMLLVNEHGHIVLVNAHIEKLFGYQRDELIGKLIEVLVPERFVAGHPAHRARFFAAPKPRSLGVGRDLFARRKDGTEFPVEIAVNPVRTPEGILVLATVIDISERKQAEEKFRLAVEASPSGILLVNQTGQIVLVNSKIEELFGYGREELIGHSVEILVPERFASEHPEHRGKFFAGPTARAMGAGRELFGRRKHGSEFPVEIGLTPVQTPDGMLVLAAVVDISARIAGEKEARRRREQVEVLGRVSLLGEMTASLAHELNQPLAAIMNNATAAMEYIEQGKLDPKQLQEILTDVIGDSRRAYDVMHNVRSAIKKGSPIRGRINLNDVVKVVTHMVHPDAAANFCRVEMSLAPDLPAIEGDPTQIQQVLINLVRNAFDAMRDTPPSRRIVEIATNSNGDGMISVAVRDYGCGISEKTRERLFEHFFTTKEEGLGMGLAIVRSIVEAHGGTIAAENADGGGARFHLRLPTKEGMLQ